MWQDDGDFLYNQHMEVSMAQLTGRNRPINVELLWVTLNHIKRNPDTWDQESWRCGSSACFAGHAALQAGGRWLDKDDMFSPWVVVDNDKIEFPDELLRLNTLTMEKGVDAPIFAAEVLGLNQAEARNLFHFRNALADLERIVLDLTEKAMLERAAARLVD